MSSPPPPLFFPPTQMRGWKFRQGGNTSNPNKKLGLTRPFPPTGAGFVDGRLGSVSMHCEWARVPVVFRLSGRPRVFWRAWLSVVLTQTLVWLPVQH
eukprot:scaffold11250_cov101-Isochrysis_galbana.AAC.4